MVLEALIFRMNLQELYAVRNSDAPENELVPDPWGKSFFSASSWMGRFLVYFYNQFSHFDASWRNQTLIQVMERIHRTYSTLFLEAKEHNACFKHSFQSLVEGKPIAQNTFRKAKSFLTDWNAMTIPFLSGMEKTSYQWKEFITRGCIDKKEGFVKEALFTPQEVSKELSRYQKIIDFEGCLGSNLPLPLLHKVSVEDGLSMAENEAFGAFCRKIGRRTHSMGITKFNRFLRATVKELQRVDKEGAFPNLVRLTTAIARRTNEIFNQRDLEHLEWRKSWKKRGTILNCNGVEVVLGRQLGKKAEESDRNIVFTVKNAPSLVVVAGVNRLILPLKEKLGQEMGFGVRSAAFVEVEKGGKFALVERLRDKLAGTKWKSKDGAYDPAEIAKVVPMIDLIAWCIIQNRIPSHFSIDYLMRDFLGEIKSTKYTFPLPFSIVDVENVLQDYAAENFSIFRLIAVKTKLSEHKDAAFFKSVVKSACMNENPDVYILSQTKEVKNFHYVDQAHALVEEIDCVKRECLGELRKKGDALPANISSIIGKKLLELYTLSGAVCTLPPEVDSQLLYWVCVALGKEKKPSKVSDSKGFLSAVAKFFKK